jgi:hypothetical protein
MFADEVTCHPKSARQNIFNRQAFCNLFFPILKPKKGVNFEELLFVTAAVTKAGLFVLAPRYSTQRHSTQRHLA